MSKILLLRVSLKVEIDSTPGLLLQVFWSRNEDEGNVEWNTERTRVQEKPNRITKAGNKIAQALRGGEQLFCFFPIFK